MLINFYLNFVSYFQVMENVYDNVGGMPGESVSFKNVIKPLIDLDGDMHTQIQTLTVSTNID